MSHRVVLVGDGLLAEYVSQLLEERAVCEVVRQATVTDIVPQGVTLAVVAHDGWYPEVHHQAEDVFRNSATPWVRGFVMFGEAILGPLVLPEIPGCSQCADVRTLMADSERQEMLQLKVKLAVHGGNERDSWASRTGLFLAAHLLADEVEREVMGKTSSLRQHQMHVHLKTLATNRHFILPHSQCAVCGTLPDDNADDAVITLKPSPKVSPNSFRCKSIDDLKVVLAKEYLDSQTGLINGKVHDLISPFTAVSVNLPLLVGDEGTSGRSHRFPDSELTAILEGLERYCGIEPRGRRTVVYDSYANVQDAALNPRSVGLHATHHYARPDFPFLAFDERAPVHWVWGYSLVQQRPILVPERLAYYSMGCNAGFVYETSNGCALGGSLEEAIFHGILEVVERDAFLLTWYAQLPLPPLDIASIHDVETRLMMDRLSATAGYDLKLFNATMEHRIPSVFAIAKNQRTTGLNLMCAAGSHIDGVRAIQGAIHEIAGMLLRFDDKLETDRNQYLEMYRDSSKLRQMEDHSMLYGLPEAEARLRFLLDENRPTQSFQDVFNWSTKHADIEEDVQDLLEIFSQLNMDVIVVNQTSPELQRNGLHCVKVLIPGMLPMTFGNDFVRLEGLDRVLNVPYQLGYTAKPLTKKQLNRYPHPFP